MTIAKHDSQRGGAQFKTIINEEEEEEEEEDEAATRREKTS
jgi:hypothetical protein